MSKKHYVIYWDKNANNYQVTTPHDWARTNLNNLPHGAPTQSIEDHLKCNYGFVEFTYQEVVVLCNLDTRRPDFDL